MDKKIKIEMKENKDIVISVNNDEKIMIKKDNRIIQANEIFELLSYSKCDNFSFDIVNEKNYDVNVLKFFYELLAEIVSKLNTGETISDEIDFNLLERE